MDRVKEFLASKALLKGDSSTASRPLRRLRGESVSSSEHAFYIISSFSSLFSIFVFRLIIFYTVIICNNHRWLTMFSTLHLKDPLSFLL